MSFLGIGILSWITFLPVLGMVIVLLLPKENRAAIRWTSLACTAVQVILAIAIYTGFDRTLTGVTSQASMQFVEKATWIDINSVAWFGRIPIEYLLGIVGISVAMVLVTALVSFIGTISSWTIEKSLKGYFALLLLLNTGMMGVFVALDFFLFYVFWEVMLLPMYFLIGVWGGPRREYAAIKFFLYTLLGSVLMLLVMLALYFNTTNPETGGHTFNMLHYMQQAAHSGWLKGFDVRILLYMGLFIGFAIKVPVFPFHTWLPDAHVEAPTAISVILAGVLLKMGTYGIFRINFQVLPEATRWAAMAMAVFGVI